MNNKRYVAISYILLGISLLMSWFYCIPHQKYHPFSVEDAEALKERLQWLIDYKFCFVATDSSGSVSTFIKDFANVTQIQSAAAAAENESLLCKDDAGKTENPLQNRMEIAVKCEKDRTKYTIRAKNKYQIEVTADCGVKYEQLRTSKSVKEARRFFKFLTEDFREDVNWEFLNELYIFNVYFIESVISRNSTASMRLETQIVTKSIEQIIELLNIDRKAIRINFKTVSQDELSLKKINNKTEQVPFENIEKFSKRVYQLTDQKHYPFKTESFNIFILGKSQGIKTFVNMEDQLYDFVEDNGYAFLINSSSNKTSFQEKVVLSLLKYFRLNYLDQLSKSLTNLDIQLTPRLALELYQHERKNFFLRSIIRELDNLKFLLEDSELIIKENACTQLQELYNKLQRILDSGETGSDSLEYVTKKLNIFNYGYEKDFAFRDTFPTDYQIGVYVPLLFPMLYPITKVLIYLFKKYKKANKESKIKFE